MNRSILYWARFAVTTSTTIITASLLNISAAFAADIPADLLNVDPGFVKAPGYSIHDKVMDQLTRGEPVDSHVKIENRDTPRGNNKDSPVSNTPTSMLWPAFKYIPQLGGAFGG